MHLLHRTVRFRSARGVALSTLQVEPSTYHDTTIWLHDVKHTLSMNNHHWWHSMGRRQRRYDAMVAA